MRYEILEGTTVINTIIADAEFMTMNYPDDNYRLVEIPTAMPVMSKQPVSRIDFLGRFTDAELEALYTAAKTVVEIEIMLDFVRAAEFINTEDPRTISGVQALEASGLIAAGRAAEILA